MRLLVVGDAASPNVQRWCDALHGAGATVSTVSFHPAWSPAIETHRLPRWLNLRAARYYLAAPVVRRIAARVRPDAVVGYFATGHATLARLSRRRPLVVVVAGSDVLLNPPGSPRYGIARRNLRAADVVLAWAPHMAVAVREFGVDAARLIVRPRGVRTDELIRPPGTRVDRRGIVSTRSLERFYRHDLLIEALADPRLADCRLTFVGSGSDQGRLREFVRSQGLDDRVAFLGKVDESDLSGVLAAHGVYASPSPSDGVSASLLEAMSVGLVPVVADIPASRAWIRDGHNGLLVEGYTKEAWAEALVRATNDDELLGAIPANRDRVIADADVDRNARLFLDDLERMLASS